MRCDPEAVPAADYDVIGFTYPVYHWTMPAPAVSFVQKLKINPKAYIFGVAMPSFVCGYACQRLAELLEEKGAELSYGALVHSVANYALVYPPMPAPKLVVPMTERWLTRIGEELAKRKMRAYPKPAAMVKARRDKVMGPYLELQQFADMPFTIADSCLSCGLCAKVCPCGNIELQNGTPTFLHHCAQCMACVVSCPMRAIGYELAAGDMELLKASSKNTPLARVMRLPEKRKLYRNPYVKTADLTKSRITIEGK